MGISTIIGLLAGPLASDMPTIVAQIENIIKAGGNQAKIQAAISGLLPIAQKFEQALLGTAPASGSSATTKLAPNSSPVLNTATTGLANGIYMSLNGTMTKIV